jgi:hypothetical protein
MGGSPMSAVLSTDRRYSVDSTKRNALSLSNRRALRFVLMSVEYNRPLAEYCKPMGRMPMPLNAVNSRRRCFVVTRARRAI